MTSINMNIFTLSKNEKGFALLLSVIVSSVVVSVGLSMLNITLKQLSLGSNTKGSEIAFQGASAGLECLQYNYNTLISDPDFTTSDGQSVVFNCFGTTDGVSDAESGDSEVQQFNPEFDWTTAGASTDYCVELEIYVLNATGGSNVSRTFSDRDISETCDAGDICTIAFSRGYNKSCGAASGATPTVQRELTIVF
ncbi:MAG: Tfp pilus assembly protein PilX [Patiriisocius sp.]|jgi:Tfp pilus assembly protein PilX